MEPFVTVEEAWESLLAQTNPHFAVDLVEHGFQTAEGLEQRGMGQEVVAAGLLHDLGDGRVSAEAHAPWAASLVRPLFGERVAWLIAAHAEAKRYLCTVDEAYAATLSDGSRQTLIEQGGLMTPEEVDRFRSHPWSEDAVALRRCDDGGKNAAYQVPDRDRFLEVLRAVAARNG